MIVFLDTSHDLYQAEIEIGYPCEQLLTPLTRRAQQRPDAPFAIDNGAFGKHGFDAKAFESLLNRNSEKKGLCRFVVVPDVTFSARRTLEVFDYWFPRLSHWKLAFVCQDGQENLPIPFEFIDALFIGGTTRFKESETAKECVKAAKAIGKWVHIGRINDDSRFEGFEQLKADSCDGTGISQYTWMRERIRERNGDYRLFSKSELVSV